MLFQLKFPENVNVRLLVRQYDPELEDVRSLLVDVCRSVEHSSGRFVVSGFGQENWPVDIGTDLSVFLEQIPDALGAIESGVETEIDFYEQGIERVITFTPCENTYHASCASRTNWQPDPEVEKIESAHLKQMLIDVRNEFLRMVRMVAPELCEHEWIKEWLR